MTEKFKNKYRIASHRKPNWNYSADALYFLTIVTQNRECILGNVINVNGQTHIKLSDFGEIVEHEWFKSFEIRNELFLHQFVIMPNHLHAIVEIHNQNHGTLSGGTSVVDTRPCVSTNQSNPIRIINHKTPTTKTIAQIHFIIPCGF